MNEINEFGSRSCRERLRKRRLPLIDVVAVVHAYCSTSKRELSNGYTMRTVALGGLIYFP